MNKAFEKILEFIDEQIKIEESIAKSKNEGRPITHQYGANCMNVIKKFVQEVSEEYNGGWIACSDNSAKLPKENEKVRVTVWTGIEKIGFMQYGKWFVYSSEGVAEATVVAWQPTEPFKERD